MMIGDSHLDTIGVFLQKELYKIGIGSYSVSYQGCPPFTGLYTPGNKHKGCHEYNQSMLDYAEQNGITDIIILVAGFSSYLNGTSYNNGEGGIRGFEGVDLIEIKDKNLSQNNKEFQEFLRNIKNNYLLYLKNFVYLCFIHRL